MRVAINGKGVLQGTTLLDPSSKVPKCHRFSRVPYALPPTGKRRWRKPEPLPASYSYGSETKPGQYTTSCSPCPQPKSFGSNGTQSPDEDCLQLNIYVPLGQRPKAGWPVFFYIHGGFLQFGSNSSEDPSKLSSQTDVKCIIVSPGYRLGVFGFLASKEICGNTPSAANFGFWDQRAALEWTYDNIQFFGGNKDNITVGGPSAGSYSTFHQLAHDVGPNSRHQLIRRVFQWSNGCGVEPKRVPEMQEQFEDLLSVLQIPGTWGALRKLAALRRTPAEELVKAVDRMKQKFFRPILDGDFISYNLFPNLFDGSFGQRMKELGIQTIIGDLTQEFHVYKRVYPPNSYDSLINRLSWDYPRDIAIAVSAPYQPSASSPPRTDEEWMEIFGRLYADMQIHSTMRGFIQSITNYVPLSSINRYRIDWRTQSLDKILPREVGATHGTDLTIWLFGLSGGLTLPEKEIVREWLQPVAAFIKGDMFEWGTSSITQVRCITAEGKIEIKEDEIWENKLTLWKLTGQVTQSSSLVRAKI